MVEFKNITPRYETVCGVHYVNIIVKRTANLRPE